MQAYVPHVVGIAAARLEIGFVAVKHFGDSQRTAFVDDFAGLPPRERAGSVDRLPIRKDVRRARAFEIISERDLLGPLGTAVGHPHRPGACPGVAAVAERDAGREPNVIRLLPHRELAAGRGTFELGTARLRQRVGLRWSAGSRASRGERLRAAAAGCESLQQMRYVVNTNMQFVTGRELSQEKILVT